MFDSVAFAMAPPQAGGTPAGGMDMLMQFLPLVLMFVIFWFLLIRPQQKRAKEHKSMLSALKRGDHVVTSSGLIGRIIEISDEEATIECGGAGTSAKLRVTRGAIAALTAGKSNRTSSAEEPKEKKSGKSVKSSDDDGSSDSDKASDTEEPKEKK